MAIYKIFPTQDTTLYSQYSEMNTGLDPIIESSLEVRNNITTSSQSSRFLIQFSPDDINNVINNKISSSLWTSNLRCFVANVTALNSDTTVDVFPVSQSWNMGTGRFGNNPETQNGASWIWKDEQGSNEWISGPLNAGTTASYTSTVDVGGGTWYVIQSWSGSQTFGFYDNKDIDIDVTNIVNAWYNSSIPNEGFIIKQQSEFIDNENIQPKLKYFSIDTHTIYPPYLEFKWIDTIITGSLPTISEVPFVVTMGENPGTFTLDSINKFRIFARPEFPIRTFQTSSVFLTNHCLPDNSSYAIKDLDTDEFVIDFDDTYTQLSKDSTSNYFTLYMKGLQKERYYKVLIKTIIDGSIVILDDNYYFKIINGKN